MRQTPSTAIERNAVPQGPRSGPAKRPNQGVAQLTDAEKVQIIRTRVQAAGDQLKARHTWLAHQDLIGLTIQLGSVAGMVLMAVLYLQDVIPAWFTVIAVAIFASFTHEMEHDLIHHMYYKHQPRMQNFLMLLGWLARPSTINPWMRREIHFHHHKVSGSATDLEERGITNGTPWGIKRVLMLADGMLSVVLRPVEMKQMSRLYVREVLKPESKAAFRQALRKKALAYWPLGTLFWAAWHAFFIWHAIDISASWMGSPIAWSPTALSIMQVLNAVAVCWLIPNVIRSFCLHFISSSMHYFGDVEPGNVMQQTQVFTHPIFWPMQLFCFNFGATHAIHHFVVGQPFYLRQMLASQAHQVMRDMGVRFNDLGSFKRANRMFADTPAA
jgi:membrane protein YdbS with pleckstrin-like domain